VSEQIKLDIDATVPAAACEHCQQPFEPRSGSGGKRQRFCSSECRTAFHAKDRKGSQRDQRNKEKPQHNDDNSEQVCNVGNSPQPALEHDIWDEDVVLHEQRKTAIYWNTAGNLVIRQLGEVHEDDPFVVICANNVDEFLDRLCDIVGIPSVGKRP
jgi:hypothetical protein